MLVKGRIYSSNGRLSDILRCRCAFREEAVVHLMDSRTNDGTEMA